MINLVKTGVGNWELEIGYWEIKNWKLELELEIRKFSCPPDKSLP